jgi:hypothetical protein
MPLALLGALVLVSGSSAAAKPVVDRVPSTVPASGFSITGCCAFRPAAQGRGLITQGRAVALARGRVDTKNWQSPAVVLATVVGRVTFGFTTKVRTLKNPTAWVVTFTGRNDVHVGLGPGGEGPGLRHETVVLDAKTGDFIRGFYTA